LSQLNYTSAWLALSDSAPDNGCVRVVRGSHKGGIVAHNASAAAGNLVSLEIACHVSAEEATDVTLRPGEMSLHHVAIVHGSNRNNSDRPRIGFAVRYVSPSVRQQIDHYPVILARGEDRFGYYRVLDGLPSFTTEEAIRAQQDLACWVLESRASSTPVPLPASCRLRFREAASLATRDMACQ
jgi:ectoine hydroxylase-related dioxygenase (phytanoyl-CoA dioxygenase family)